MTDTVTTLELTGFDEAATGLVTKYFTRRDRSVISGASDTPAKTSFEPRMVNAGTFDLFMFSNARLGGAGAPAGGAIVLDNHDGGLDYLRGWGLDGRSMTLRRGVVGQAYPSAYTTLLKGTMLAPHFSMTDVTLRIRSRLAEVLNQTLQRDRYKGDNALPDGVEGTEDDIKGLYKPEFWGKGRHIPVVLVNTSKNTYQISRGAITSLDALYVQGAATWTPGTAHASLAALQAATVPASTYDYYLGGNGDGSYLRLGSNPTGAVTVDATAPKSTAADIVDDILQAFAGIPSGEIEGKSTLNTANSAPMGYWSGTGQVTMGQAIFEILDSIGGFLTEKRNGNFLMGRLEAPGGSPALTITQTYVDETAGPPEIITNSDIAREVPVYRVGVGYKKVYQVQTGGELAGAATQATRALVGEELRYSVYQDGGALLLEGGAGELLLEGGAGELLLEGGAGSLLLEDVRSKHPLAGELIVPALFDDESDAQAEALRRFQLHGVDRELVNLPVVNRITGSLNINDVVEVLLDRYHWGDGKLFRVVGISEDFNSEVTVLQLFG